MENNSKATAGWHTIDKSSPDNPKIYTKRISNGRLSLNLEYYLGFDTQTDPETGKQTVKIKRRRESLNLYLYDNPRTPKEREHNRQTKDIAAKLRYEGEQRLNQRETGFRVKSETKKIDFLKYYREYIDNYTKKDLRNVRISYYRFSDFLNDTPKYKVFSKSISPNQIDKEMIEAFTEYLQKRSVRGGALSIYKRFKKVVKYATEHEVFTKNPCTGVSIKYDTDMMTKDILTLDEIQTLANTPFPQNANTARAFLFCCLTGLRWCDVRNLTFANVDYSNKVLSFTQQKTEGHSAHSGVTIPLNDTTMALIGEKGDRDDTIFVLPSYEAACKCVKLWIKKAGIDKHISWHCARHSFAVNVLSNGADIKTTSSLLGHSSIAMTERYLHVVDNLKRAAMENPAMNIKLS